MAIHEVRHVGLRNAENSGDFALLEVSRFDDFVNAIADLRPCKQLVRILEPKVGKDVAAALFKFDFLMPHVSQVPLPLYTVARSNPHRKHVHHESEISRASSSEP